ncbi:MAG: hypothetical protein ACRYF8_19940, partial [Janthinobacterium lividum]
MLANLIHPSPIMRLTRRLHQQAGSYGFAVRVRCQLQIPACARPINPGTHPTVGAGLLANLIHPSTIM